MLPCVAVITRAWEPVFSYDEEVSPFNSRLVERGSLLHGQAEGMQPAGVSGLLGVRWLQMQKDHCNTILQKHWSTPALGLSFP